MTSKTTNSGIFKANDIRGIYGDSLTDDDAHKIGLALAMDAGAATPIALGRDGRLSSPALADALAAGLVAGGLEVFDIGLAPTPALYYAAVKHCGGSGVMVTGSHNPKHYNGMKMMLRHETVRGDALQGLARRVQDNALVRERLQGGVRKPLAVRDEYIGEVVNAVPLPRPLKIVIDAGNGAAGEYAPALFRALGCDVAPLYCDIDGNFPNHHPDPAVPENLRDAEQLLRRQNADVALAFDGDGDRLGVVMPGLPVPIHADWLLMLFARDMLSRHPGGGVVFDVKCSALLKPWIEKHRGVADMQPTGHAFIKARMKESGALFGGEMSGHFYFRENWYGFDDALFAGARLLAILAADPSAFAGLPESCASPEIQIGMGDADQHEFVRRLQQTADFPDAVDIVTMDGLRVEYADGFGLVRASNTTPSLVLRFEAVDERRLAEIQSAFRGALLAADANLDIPF